jgi:arginine-tRNA-protein transferase
MSKDGGETPIAGMNEEKGAERMEDRIAAERRGRTATEKGAGIGRTNRARRRNEDDLLFGPAVSLPCPYGGNAPREAFLANPERRSAEEDAILVECGFRITSAELMLPTCPLCSACVTVRIPVATFSQSRTQRRNRRTNADLVTSFERLEPDFKPNAELLSLFNRYLEARHPSSSMHRLERKHLAALLGGNGTGEQWILTVRTKPENGGKLLGFSHVHVRGRTMAGIYQAFEPNEPKRGIGTFLILELLDAAKTMNVTHLYPGDAVVGLSEMAYKFSFRPIEHLSESGWTETPEGSRGEGLRVGRARLALIPVIRRIYAEAKAKERDDSQTRPRRGHEENR